MKKLSTLFAFAFALSLTAPVLAEETANAPAKEDKSAGEKKKDDTKKVPPAKHVSAASEEAKAEKAEKPAKKGKKPAKEEKKEEPAK